jgi:hypothetical protein
MPRRTTTSGRLRATNRAQPPDRPTFETRWWWKLLNSSFFLWLLSSLVISFGTWGYAQWKAAEAKKAELAEKITKLDHEIENRLNVGGIEPILLETLSETATKVLISQEEARSLISEFLSAPTEDRMLFVEFSKRGTLSLMKELSLSLEGNDRKCVEIAIAKVQHLKSPSASFKNYGQLFKHLSLIADYRWSLNAKVYPDLASAAVNLEKLLGLKQNDNNEGLRCGANIVR